MKGEGTDGALRRDLRQGLLRGDGGGGRPDGLQGDRCKGKSQSRASAGDLGEVAILGEEGGEGDQHDPPSGTAGYKGRGLSRCLVALEREAFLAGYYKAFLLSLDGCRICSKCAGDRAKSKADDHLCQEGK